MDDVFESFKNMVKQIKEINEISKSPETCSDYKNFIYAEEARTRANLKRLLPTIIIILVTATYIFIVDIIDFYSSGSTYVASLFIFSFILLFMTIYAFLIAKFLNKSNIDIKKGKAVYMSFWISTILFIFIILVLTYFRFGEMREWSILFFIIIIAPIFNLFESAVIIAISSVLALIFSLIIQLSTLSFLLLEIPLIIIMAIVFQSTYIERMRVLLTQRKIEHRGYMAQRRMESLFNDLFDEVYVINLNNNYFELLQSKGTFQSSNMKSSYQKSVDYIAHTLVHPEDSEQYANKFSIDNIKSELREEKNQIYYECRRLRSTGEYAWVSTLLIREYSENSDEFKLMHLVQDIDSRKTSEVKLKTEAQCDPLTKLYNKTTTKKLIEDFIDGEGAEGTHAFIIIDMDEFKSINDTYGHFAGDDALEKLAVELKGHFRESDILGRIGGDEFVAFVKNIQSVALVCDKVQRISASLKKYGIEHGYSRKVSTSMGIAIFNKDGKNYEELYKNADKALYEAKLNGRDQYKFSIRNH